MNLLPYMPVFGFQFVKVFGPMAWLTKMYDTSPESCVQGIVDRLVFVHSFELLRESEHRQVVL